MKLTEEAIETICYEWDLYEAFFRGDIDSYYKIWNEIKEDEGVLKNAIRLIKNRKGNDTLVGLTIAEAILAHYDEISPDIYNELIKTIYTNESIARINRIGKFTFLEMTLYNPDLELTKEQKRFALREAMMQYNTSLKLYSIPASHSTNSFDIRYLILTNQNWDIEEKAELIYDFYKDDEYYDKVLDDWEEDIINYRSISMPLNKDQLYEYTYQDLSYAYNKEDADSIYEEITMCKLFHQMRPQAWEINNLDSDSKAVVYTKKNDTI